MYHALEKGTIVFRSKTKYKTTVRKYKLRYTNNGHWKSFCDEKVPKPSSSWS